MGPLRFMMTGNDSHIVSYSTYHHCVSTRQETIRVWFLIRHGTIAFHLHRKLFAYGFLSGMTPLRFNLSRKLFAYGFLSGMAPLRFNLGRKLL